MGGLPWVVAFCTAERQPGGLKLDHLPQAPCAPAPSPGPSGSLPRKLEPGRPWFWRRAVAGATHAAMTPTHITHAQTHTHTYTCKTVPTGLRTTGLRLRPPGGQGVLCPANRCSQHTDIPVTSQRAGRQGAADFRPPGGERLGRGARGQRR